MVTFANSISTALGYLGIRWTNTDDPEPSAFLRAERALKNPAVWYAVNKISGHIGQLPLNIHQQTESGRIEKPTEHFAYQLLRVKPNAYQSPIVFKRLLTSHALLWGNGYAYIHKLGRRVEELIPLRPDCMAVGLQDGEKIFWYVPNKDERISLWEAIEEGQGISFTNDEIFHIQGLGSDGICGYSLLTLAREAWEAGLAATNRTLSSLQKGHSGGIVLEVPSGQLRDETKANEFLKAWRRDQDGAGNAGKTAMLREGVQAKVLAMSNKDAEFVSTLLFMRQEEALRFMLENILGDDSSVSYNSLEQKNLAYLQNCLNTWLRVWEEEGELKLLSARDLRNGFYLKFNDGALLRTDKSTSMQTAALAIQSKVWTRNEVREMFDMNPVEGGDVFENPAITPGNTDQPPPDDAATEDESTSTAATNKQATVVLFERLLKIECQRAEQASSSAKNFCDWIDKFYAKWESKLADDIEQVGGDRDLATTHCNESRQQLLDCAGRATGETLPSIVSECVSTWVARAATLANEMELVNV